jgi:hypothetical protein
MKILCHDLTEVGEAAQNNTHGRVQIRRNELKTSTISVYHVDTARYIGLAEDESGWTTIRGIGMIHITPGRGEVEKKERGGQHQRSSKEKAQKKTSETRRTIKYNDRVDKLNAIQTPTERFDRIVFLRETAQTSDSHVRVLEVTKNRLMLALRARSASIGIAGDRATVSTLPRPRGRAQGIVDCDSHRQRKLTWM